ncbi:MFS transporter [Kibdelosporangium persicum]|uniref:Thiamine ABC transporter, transmembrane component n=1 Tax=Kibdelosporangium persicum TaxID=2698649 RepID=A0ABX2F4K5_9PSEU|nr:MFS transporter [Kibdelosporangium persicum]NRN66274.1 Thiamine ABC transporter, transmembrane component [Kibdelosporangium persicum]
MSHNVSFADYRAALTTPGAGGPMIAAVFARLPIAMVGFAMLFYVQRATGSYAVAGLVSAGALIGSSIGSVLQGRVMDRLGPSRPLLVASTAFTVFVAIAIMGVEAGMSAPALVGFAFAVGLTQPTVGSASRTLWSRLLPAGRTRQAAYNYDAISIEVFFILGPGLAGLLSALPWAGTGVLVSALSQAAGAITFALTKTVRAQRPLVQTGTSLLGPLVSPGMRTVILAVMGFGVVIGFVEVAVPAAATAAGQQAMGGVMLSVWSISSVIFGVIYGMRPWPRPMHLRLPVLLAGFAILVTFSAIPSSLLWLAVTLLIAGMMITPQSTSHSTALEQVAPPSTMTEAFGWVITAVTFGLALGQSASGYLVEHVSVSSAFIAAAVAGLIFAGLVFVFRGTIAAGVPSRKADHALAS